jgi:hypothetical protein
VVATAHRQRRRHYPNSGAAAMISSGAEGI